jgi:hypothetical protein
MRLPNKRMKLAKLSAAWLPEWTCRLIPAPRQRRLFWYASHNASEEYNEERPHEALVQEAPASVYEPSARQFPRKLAELEYPGHYERRYVSENCGIRWKCAWVNVTTTLAHEWVGLEEVGDWLWDVYFSRLRLGRLGERRMQIEDPYGRWPRWEALSPMSLDRSVTHIPD